MFRLPFLIWIWAALVLGSPLDVKAQTSRDGVPIEIGRSFTIPSLAMGADRTINVWLPPGYSEGDQRYPVLYLLDGGINQDFHHISGLAQLGTIAGTTRDMIVIGVETVDRRNELRPPTSDAELLRDYPTAGESARFRRFVSEEVMRWVDERYRTTRENALIGESLAGHFVIETLLRAPDMFDTYIAISPSLWWDGGALNAEAAERLNALSPAKRRLWLTVADEGDAMGVDGFAALLRQHAPASLAWTFTPMPDETHATVYHGAAHAALRALYPMPKQ